jgi:uncharacterized protein YjbI with pentapeptide repeats
MNQLTKTDVLKRLQRGESFVGENLASIDLSGTPLASINLTEADLNNTVLIKADLTDANFNNANLSDANFSGAVMRKAFLVGANLTGANFEGADLEGAFLSGAILSGTNFRDADLRHATIGAPHWITPDPFGSLTSFENANLEESIFGETVMKGVILLGAKLKGAYLYEVDLSKAVYKASDLEGAATKKAFQESIWD